MNELPFQREMSFQDVIIDVITSLALIIGAWVTTRAGEYFFPEGIPLVYAFILHARDIATVLWVIGATARYLKFAYQQINQVVQYILKTSLYSCLEQIAHLSTVNAITFWQQLDQMSQKLSLLILITVSSVGIFRTSHSFIDVLLPPIYWALIFGAAHGIELLGKRGRVSKAYWLAAFLLFMVLWLALSHLAGVPIIEHGYTLSTTAGDQLRLLLVLSNCYLIIIHFGQQDIAQWQLWVKNKWRDICTGQYPTSLQLCLI